MPTNRRYRRQARRQQVGDLDASLLYELLTGRGYWSHFPDAAALAAAWEYHRPWILPLWLETAPCSRPFGWWLCEAVPRHGERRVIDDTLDDDVLDHWRRHGVLHSCTHPPIQESQAEYLGRHGLMTPAERRLVERDGAAEYVQAGVWFDLGLFTRELQLN